MPEKDPFNYSFAIYSWVVGLSLFSGLVSYIRKVRENTTETFSIMKLLGEMVVAAFVGLITFWLCEAAEIPMTFTAPLIGICSHMGSRLIFTLESVIDTRMHDILRRIGLIK